MVQLIKETKDIVLERLDKSINEKGPERMNVQEVGMLADVVKDLAEAEKACWEAEYYKSVTEAMQDGSMGYDEGMGYRDGGGSQGGQRGGSRSGYRMGYRGQSRDSMGRYSSRGYHGDPMEDIREMMENADPTERERIRKRLREMAG